MFSLIGWLVVFCIVAAYGVFVPLAVPFIDYMFSGCFNWKHCIGFIIWFCVGSFLTYQVFLMRPFEVALALTQ